MTGDHGEGLAFHPGLDRKPLGHFPFNELFSRAVSGCRKRECRVHTALLHSLTPHVHAHVPTPTHIQGHTCIHACTCTHRHIHAHAHTDTCKHTRPCTHMYTETHAHTYHTHRHAHMCTPTQACTHSRVIPTINISVSAFITAGEPVSIRYC